jgi:TetR/AcrR family tetracycline transcriptional repressor
MESGTVTSTTVPRPRPRLSPERILDAALRLVDAEGEAGLTFRRLAEELGADPTAVYRHFRSKDDLLLALADRLLVQVVEDTAEHSDWRTTVRDLLLAAHQALVRHPRLAVLVSTRTTQGPGESRGIERMLSALTRAGLPPAEAVTTGRALGDTMLAWAGLSAAFVTLPEHVRDADRSAWTLASRPVAPEDFPHLAASGTRLPFTTERQQFAAALDLMLDGLAARLATSTHDRSPQ